MVRSRRWTWLVCLAGLAGLLVAGSVYATGWIDPVVPSMPSWKQTLISLDAVLEHKRRWALMLAGLASLVFVSARQRSY